jgi:hypothetical protein
MSARALRVSVAMLAALTVASVCLAQEPAPAAAPDTAKTREAAIGLAPGQGAIGVQVGASMFRPDRAIGNTWFADYSSGAEDRLAFHAHWRYAVHSWLRWQIGIGFTWAAYSGDVQAPFADPNFPGDVSKGDYLTLLLPVSAQAQWTFRRGLWVYHVGAGPGVYRVWVQNRRKVLKDPVSLQLHRGIYPGGSGEIGFERFLRGMPSTSLEFVVAGHLAMARRDEQFPSGFNSSVMAIEARVGANYYFAPGDRKKTSTAGPKLP